jgi:hypothetical protein
MCDATFYRILRRGQCLANYLPTKYLRAAKVTTVAAKNILFDALETQKPNKIFEYRMHADQLSVRRPSTAIPVSLTNPA